MNSPAHAPQHASAFSPRGRNLARHHSSLPGHLLFPEQAHDLAAHLSNANEAAVLPPVASTGAAIDRRHATAAPSTAKSRPFPFPQINHVTHLITSAGDTSEPNGSVFA
jgi:hypothetical protein